MQDDVIRELLNKLEVIDTRCRINHLEILKTQLRGDHEYSFRFPEYLKKIKKYNEELKTLEMKLGVLLGEVDPDPPKNSFLGKFVDGVKALWK